MQYRVAHSKVEQCRSGSFKASIVLKCSDVERYVQGLHMTTIHYKVVHKKVTHTKWFTSIKQSDTFGND